MFSMRTWLDACPIAKGQTTRIVDGSTMRPISEEREMSRTRRLGVIATLLVLSCASCTNSADPPSSSPTPASSSTAPTAPTSSPTPSAPAYLSKYGDKERKAYAHAVSAYELFAEEQAKILAVGKATPKAKRYYEKYSGDWLTYWNVLRQREADGIRIEGRGETLRVRPARIKLGDDGSGSVDLRVCGVASGVKVFQRGTPIPQPNPTPKIVKVSLFQLTGESWWRVFLERVGGSC